MGRVVHFEITADDTARAKQFYELFGWEITDAGMPGTEYWLAHTGDDLNGINGAIMPRTYQTQPVIPWIAVDNLAEAVAKVQAAGGSVKGERQTVPNVGDTMYCTDTEGNIIGLLQPVPMNP